MNPRIVNKPEASTHQTCEPADANMIGIDTPLTFHDMRVPFKLLQSKHKVEMIRLWREGRTIEVWSPSVDGWRRVDYPLWLGDRCYRVALSPQELAIYTAEEELLILDRKRALLIEELDLLGA